MRVNVQGNHSSSFPPSQRMCAGWFQVVVAVKWAQVVFPGRPLRVERRGCISQGEGSPKACSLMLGRIPLYCVVARCASNVVQRTGPASDWRQRTLVVSAQDTPFATETWRGVVCWRGGWFRGWRGGGWWWCCGGGVEREVEVVVGSDGVQGGGCGVGSGQGNLRERCCCCCGGVSWRERKAHSGGAMSSPSPSSTSTTTAD